MSFFWIRVGCHRLLRALSTPPLPQQKRWELKKRRPGVRGPGTAGNSCVPGRSKSGESHTTTTAQGVAAELASIANRKFPTCHAAGLFTINLLQKNLYLIAQRYKKNKVIYQAPNVFLLSTVREIMLKSLQNWLLIGCY